MSMRKCVPQLMKERWRGVPMPTNQATMAVPTLIRALFGLSPPGRPAPVSMQANFMATWGATQRAWAPGTWHIDSRGPGAAIEPPR